MNDFKSMKDLQGDMYAHGAKMGFAKGGKVMGKMQTSSMDSMDHGVQPARTGITEQDKEAGGTPKLRPRYKKGGDVKQDKEMIGKAIKKHEKTPKPRGHGMEKGGKAVHKGKAKLAAKGVKAVNEAKKVLGGQITEKEAARLKKGKGKPVHKSTPMFGKGGRSC